METELSVYRRIMDVNFFGTVQLTRLIAAVGAPPISSGWKKSAAVIWGGWVRYKYGTTKRQINVTERKKEEISRKNL